MSRRRFLQSCGWGGLGLALGAGAVWALDRPERQPLPVRLGSLASLPEGGVRLYPEQEVCLIRRREGLALVSLRCTHLGCRLRLAGQQLVCPCHGGRFDLNGDVLSGPPPTPLPWYHGRLGLDGRVYLLPRRTNEDRELIRL